MSATLFLDLLWLSWSFFVPCEPRVVRDVTVLVNCPSRPLSFVYSGKLIPPLEPEQNLFMAVMVFAAISRGLLITRPHVPFIMPPP